MTLFDRYRPAIALHFLGCAAVPLTFGHLVLMNGSPITPEQYGEVVWSIPALVWVGVQLAGAVGGFVATVMRWRLLAGFSGLIVSVMMMTLAALAVQAGPTAALVVSGCGLWLGPQFALIAFACWWGRNAR